MQQVDGDGIHGNRKNSYSGYFSDFTAANMYTLTAQMPFVQDMAANYMLDEPEDEKKITLDWYSCVLHKPRTIVTSENYSTLNMLSKYKQYSDLSRKETGEMLRYHAETTGVTPESIRKWIYYYPECIKLAKEVEIDDLFA